MFEPRSWMMVSSQTMYSSADYEEARAHIRTATPLVPRIGLVLGSGMSDAVELVTDRVTVSYADIPHLSDTSAPGHEGQLHLGNIAGVPCVVMQGRLHLYEGHHPERIAFPVRLMRCLGTEVFIGTNAAGGINKNLNVGDLVLVEDHLSLAGLAGLDPTRGENASRFGPRFTSLNRAYEPKLIEVMERSAVELGIRAQRGVYGFACGPSFETPAEVRFLSIIGVDAVGMSTVPEVITARHCGMKVAVISAITNMAIQDLTSRKVATEEEVWENAPAILKKVTPLLEMLIKEIGSGEL